MLKQKYLSKSTQYKCKEHLQESRYKNVLKHLSVARKKKIFIFAKNDCNQKKNNITKLKESCLKDILKGFS